MDKKRKVIVSAMVIPILSSGIVPLDINKEVAIAAGDDLLTDARVGEKLNESEAGWTRYDNSDPAIKYTNMEIVEEDGYYGPSLLYARPHHDYKVTFDFTGTKLRLISDASPGYSDDIGIRIDGVDYPFSEKLTDTVQRRILVFEILGLEDGRHNVEIYRKSGDTAYFGLDAVDVGENEELLTPIKHEAQIGDRIDQPEDGWKRYDGTNSSYFNYEGNWTHLNGLGSNTWYGGSSSYANAIKVIKFPSHLEEQIYALLVPLIYQDIEQMTSK